MAGNANSGKHKAKLWRDALHLLILAPADQEARGKTILHKLVATQVNLALGGDIQALKDIADRLDGKPAQAIVGDDEHDAINLVTRIERVIVRKGDVKEDSGANE